MKKFLSVFIILIVCSSLLNAQEKPKGTIDWENSQYIAVGECPVSDKYPSAIAKQKAKDYAKMQAIADLFMLINSTTISMNAVGSDYTADVTLKQEIEGLVRNVKVTESKIIKDEDGDSFARVTVVQGIYGTGNAGSVLLKKSVEEDKKVLAKTDIKSIVQPKTDIKPEEPVVIAKAEAIPVKIEKKEETLINITQTVEYVPAKVSSEKQYTGLIIDATGFKLDRSMSPKIRLENGDIVWTGANFDFDLLYESGILSYADSMKKAYDMKRAGDNPLVIKAVNVAGNGKLRTDLCITADDAAIMKLENSKSRFLDEFKIIVVSDYLK